LSTIITESRNQFKLFALEEMVDKESIARTIDIFVDQMDLVTLGFVDSKSKTGRPSYPVNAMIKLFLYGYMYNMLN